MARFSPIVGIPNSNGENDTSMHPPPLSLSLSVRKYCDLTEPTNKTGLASKKSWKTTKKEKKKKKKKKKKGVDHQPKASTVRGLRRRQWH
jgi:hypothetical protein